MRSYDKDLTEKRTQKLSWKTLEKYYNGGNRKNRAMINREARRCGYAPSTLFAIHKGL